MFFLTYIQPAEKGFKVLRTFVDYPRKDQFKFIYVYRIFFLLFVGHLSFKTMCDFVPFIFLL